MTNDHSMICRADTSAPFWPIRRGSFARYSERGQGPLSRRHYVTHGTLDEIEALPVRELAAADRMLFLWVPGPCLFAADSHARSARWGFSYSAIGIRLDQADRKRVATAVFLDASMGTGIGRTTRQNAEDVAAGRRGKPQPAPRTCISSSSSRGANTRRKPDEQYASASSG